MSVISMRLPDSLHNQVRALAKREGISINQFAASAIAEKISALLTEEYLEHRAARGDRGAFEAALAQVPNDMPDLPDTLG